MTARSSRESFIFPFLSITGAAASLVGISFVLAANLKPGEFTIGVTSAVIALLAGVFSAYLASAARKVGRAKRIFISYPHQETPLAHALAEALRDRGARVWLEQENVGPGESIRATIEDAMAQTDTLVVLFSPGASPNLQLELGAARANGVAVIPVKVGEGRAPVDLEGVGVLELGHDRTEGLKAVVKAST